MAQESKILHFFHKNKPSLFKSTIEKFAYIAGIASPVVTLPQVFQIWISKDSSGVSLVTWISYLLIVIVMTLYGFVHRERPLVVMYGSLILIDLSIIIGAIIY